MQPQLSSWPEALVGQIKSTRMKSAVGMGLLNF